MKIRLIVGRRLRLNRLSAVVFLQFNELVEIFKEVLTVRVASQVILISLLRS
jgi:hypothetical protein